MSDPMSNSDNAEDVLSSIRRLVIDTTPGADTQDAAENLPVPAGDVLLLTMDQRVDLPQLFAGERGDGTVAELDSLRRALGDNGDDSQTTEDHVLGGPASNWVAPTPEPDDYYEDQLDDLEPLAVFEEQEINETLINPFDGTIDAQTEAWLAEEADIADPDPADAGAVSPEDEAALEAWTRELAATDAAIEAQIEADLESRLKDITPFSAGGPAPVQEERETSLMEDLGVAKSLRRSDGRGPVMTPPAEDVAFTFTPINADEVENAFADDSEEPGDPLLDEEMLRDLIADVVRQELRGELGERITRNMRKLVRREVHRALLTREFD